MLALRYVPRAAVLGFVPLDARIMAIAVTYVVVTEWQKAWFYRRMDPRTSCNNERPR